MDKLDDRIEKVVKLYFKGFSLLEAIEIVKNQEKTCDSNVELKKEILK